MINKFKKIGLLLIFFVSIYTFIYYQNNYLDVINYEIINSKIPVSFNGFKIIQISDYHNTTNEMLNKSVKEQIKDIKPNLIMITGDLIDSTYTNVNQAISLIDSIKEVAPIYFVTGNHETWSEQYHDLYKELIKREVNVLNNEKESIYQKDDYINILGVEDSETIIDLRENLKGVEKDKDIFKILLSHRPEHFEEYVKLDLDLVLTGHAHGGQIRILNQGLVAPNQGVFPKYTSGVITKDNTTMIISRGIGNSVIPIRINNHPELVVITLKNK